MYKYKLYTFLFMLCAAQINAMNEGKATFEHRVENFNKQLEKHLADHDSSDNFQIVQPAKYDYFYDLYTNGMVKALQSSTSPTERCQARAKVVETTKYYPVCQAGDQLLTQRFGPLFCAFTQRHPFSVSDTYRFDDTYVMPVTPQFEQCSFPRDSNCCVGYVKQPNNKYRLHVCHKQTGFPVWISPIESKIKHPYSIADGTLYYGTDEKKVVQLDLNTHKGNIVGTNMHTIRDLKALDKNTFITLHNKSAIIVNAATKKRDELAFSADSYPHKAFFTDLLVVPTSTSFNVSDRNGNCNEIPHFNAASPLAVPYIATAKNIIAYQEENRWVRCLELTPASKIAAAREICRIPALRNVKKMLFSSDAKIIYILTDFSLKAVAVNESPAERFKWETPLNPSKIDNIYVTNRGWIYGYCAQGGTCYKFDPEFGTTRRISPLDASHFEIVGDRDINSSEDLFVKLTK